MLDGPALITGATGFIGGRLAEMLALSDVEVHAAVRRYSRAANLARFPVQFVHTPTGDASEYFAATDRCSVVFHCAHDFGSQEDNLRSSRALLEACARGGVSRLVYMSSFSAYIPLGGAQETITEATPWEPTSWDYAAAKRAVSTMLLDEGARTGVNVTVLEPPCVYGPFSFPFAIYPVQQLRTSKVVVPHDDEGWCNLVYVDDLIDAMISAATVDAAIGERFIINGDDFVSWRQFYESFAEVIGTGEIRPMRRHEVEPLVARDSHASEVRRVFADPVRLLRAPAAAPIKRVAKRLLGRGGWTRARAKAPLPVGLPERETLDFRWRRYTASPDKAGRLLGYKPKVSASEGLRRCGEFVAWARL